MWGGGVDEGERLLLMGVVARRIERHDEDEFSPVAGRLGFG
jgi:hypothetical protein